MPVEGPDVSSWFDDDELESCPSCGAPGLPPRPASAALRVCLACGHVVDERRSPGQGNA